MLSKSELEMMTALEADGRKLKQLIGTEHRPFVRQTPTEWTLETALPLIREVETICPRFGCHVALTGGTLYKDGMRKDLDLLFYRVRQVEKIDEQGLLDALSSELGIEVVATFGWVTKATYVLRKLDLFFPDRADAQGDQYGNDPHQTDAV